MAEHLNVTVGNAVKRFEGNSEFMIFGVNVKVLV
jgi:hypothetical protein